VNSSFRAIVKGRFIRSVVFSVGSRTLANRKKSPFAVLVGAGRGVKIVVARVMFADATPAKTLRMRYRPCAAATRTVRPQRPRTPHFTG
jgi:hypothetical protein